MPPPTASEEPHPFTAFLRRHLDALICLGATITIVLAPAGLPIWVIVAVVVAICFAYQAWRFTRLLAARVEMLETASEDQGDVPVIAAGDGDETEPRAGGCAGTA